MEEGELSLVSASKSVWARSWIRVRNGRELLSLIWEMLDFRMAEKGTSLETHGSSRVTLVKVRSLNYCEIYLISLK